MTATIVKVRALTKSYHRGPETVHAGEVVALVGPSGSGKTTLLNILYGWEHPDEGSVTWTATGDEMPESREWNEASVIPQRLGLIEELTIFENVELPLALLELSESDARQRVQPLLEKVGIDHIATHHPSETSLGEQQRTAVARALVTTPRLVLADEPTGHQDADSERAVFRALREIAASGGACLVATHNPEATRFCHRTMRVEDGIVVVDERVADEVLERELSPFSRPGDPRPLHR
jgi:putative ABC transport system ATP-binding protein